MTKPVIWYWERMSSPHKAALLVALAQKGCDVVYVVESMITPDRASQGWSVPELPGVRLELVNSEQEVERLVSESPARAIHICDGIRANGLVSSARACLRRTGHKFFIFMETVDDDGIRGFLKKLEYRRLFWFWRRSIAGVLAAGSRTCAWVVRHGLRSDLVFPFAYFLPNVERGVTEATDGRGSYRFVFVGQFIERKRLDLLIGALSDLKEKYEFELSVVGSGPLEGILRCQAEDTLVQRLNWVGKLPMTAVSAEIARADCLVLPSRHDGWGAVVSEALIIGTPVICSDRCGASVAVVASACGGVFKSGCRVALAEQLERMLAQGRRSSEERNALSQWAKCLGAEAGAEYLLRILCGGAGMGKPSAPWS